MKKVGILGGGQLGRMLLQDAANYPVETYVLENDPNCPAAHLCQHFVLGNIKDYDTVLAFGRQVDVLTIEIEAVNVDALEQLEKEGITVIPKPAVLRTIKNKITQKAFYKDNQIPSPDFVVTHTLKDLQQHAHRLPAVHKVGEGGYDGKGVVVMKDEAAMAQGFDAPSVLENMVDIAQEIALIVAVGTDGKHVLFPPAEMLFDPALNLLDYQLTPANITKEVLWKAEAIAIRLVKAFDSPGLFAVELLVDKKGEVWVNETAPRVHNSGHHTIEAHLTSQYEMLWRILLQYPLGATDMVAPSAIINLIGEPGYSGPAHYEGLEQVLGIQGAFVHIYGKADTKPGRKMGHVTVLGTDRTDLVRKAKMVKDTLKVQSK
ncbi:5-(carboxyamino)imidazole ribonucleotide synthase [Phnomibacter ginsenosidimutans]|uniref:N5-carboxyaminoimidazole ribonucleotide synthase n=1 Tax=Phnomibacter ginsenosidimutans TaxID=2676868 RepID=A0A6I6G9F2_9BACT|nr:5-(carboxyamino)imidazole ribonucleotide synthase [Phnomibacter ginsenosidimutans]QGW28163.1 5-(carboxyamino)imidazole ribonucleotide synthase [Phnomibacter ginsenosidimutans]